MSESERERERERESESERERERERESIASMSHLGREDQVCRPRAPRLAYTVVCGHIK